MRSRYCQARKSFKSRNRQLRQNFKSSISKKSIQKRFKNEMFVFADAGIFNFQEIIDRFKFLREIRCVQISPQDHEKCVSVASLKILSPLRILKNRMSKVHSSFYTWNRKSGTQKFIGFGNPLFTHAFLKRFIHGTFLELFIFETWKDKRNPKSLMKLWRAGWWKFPRKFLFRFFKNHFRAPGQ